jgi:DNA-binding NarL/FixJ family response regulator
MNTAAASRSDVPVVVVDDHELVGDSVVMALRDSGLSACRVRFRSEQDVLRGLGSTSPGLVLLDLDLGTDDGGNVIDGQAMIDEMRATGWRVVVMSGLRDRSRIAEAVAAGVLGYVSKSARLLELVHAVVEAVEGRQIMSATERRQWEELHRRDLTMRGQWEKRLVRLAPREREVLDLLARGLRVSAIAERFVVSEATVRTQVKSILRKLEVNSQIEAVAIQRAATRS